MTAVYESGNSAAGSNTQIVMFVGGHLANADPAGSIAGFTQQVKGAKVVSPGPGGGKAVCLQEGTAGAACAWFDNDSFGEVVSPTMDATALAKADAGVPPVGGGPGAEGLAGSPARARDGPGRLGFVRLAGQGPGDGLPDPPGGVGGELVALGVVELLHRPDQAQVALLDQLRNGMPRPV